MVQEIVIGIANTITIKQDDKGEIEFTDARGSTSLLVLELLYQHIWYHHCVSFVGATGDVTAI